MKPRRGRRINAASCVGRGRRWRSALIRGRLPWQCSGGSQTVCLRHIAVVTPARGSLIIFYARNQYGATPLRYQSLPWYHANT